MSEIAFNSDEMIAHIVKKTDLLDKYVQANKDNFSFDPDEFHDFAYDEVHNSGKEIHHEVAYGGLGPFHIQVIEYSGIFYLCAPDFDNVGYFLKKEEALECADAWASEFNSEYLDDPDYIEEHLDPASDEYIEAMANIKLKHWSGPYGLVNCTSDEDDEQEASAKDAKPFGSEVKRPSYMETEDMMLDEMIRLLQKGRKKKNDEKN
ncbi:MAG: hypothetical protein ACPH7H_06905 [Porticoccaceae bacterium]